MSPASQGTLEVERYIGSCLISANVRTGTHKTILNKKLDQNNPRGKNKVSYSGQNYSNTSEQCSMQYGSSPGGWAGAPLISMTSSPRRCNQRSSPSLGQQQHQLQSPQQQSQQLQQQQQSQQLQQHAQVCEGQPQQLNGHLHKSPLSRLAIHTQGAPLILAGRFHNRGKVHASNGVPNNLALGAYVHSNGNSSTNTMNGSTMNATRCPAPPRARRPIESTKKTTTSNSKSDCSTVSKDSTGTNIANIDSLSIASDESSGSNNSENSLPRIIKPRKRRKKDRKPPNGGIVVSSDNPITKSDESQQQLQQQQTQQHQRTSPNTMTDLKPYVSGSCYEQQRYDPSLPVQQRNHRRPPIGRESVYSSCRAQVSASSVQQAIGDIRQQRYAHRHVQVKVLDDNRNVLVPGTMRTIQSKAGYRPHSHHHHHHHHHHHVVSNNNNIASRYVHQDYNDVPCEDSLADGLGLCQCRYCDPSGLIWDVDQNGYSPYLTVPTSNDFCNQYPQQPAMFLSRGSSLASQDRPQQHQATIERLFDTECSRLTRPDRDTGNAATLRRSWSDPTSYFSDEISTPSRDVGVIGDRGQSENGKRCGGTFWHGDTASAGIGPNGAGNVSSSNNNSNNVGATSPSSKGLEVSTEIVTSPNGHRDLEIKFYSPSPPNAPVTVISEDKSILLAEEEDFNDIWSYHESKLQQDFRSLLQAEE